MRLFKRILVPLDFSPGSEDAFAAALTFASKFEAKIVAVHVHELDGFGGLEVPGAPALVTEPLRATEDREVAKMTGQMQLFLDRMAKTVDSLPEIEFFERRGEASKSIVDFAESSEIDLIVMGTHGRTGISHLMLGSVAERVVRGAPCPVLTIRIGERQAA